MARPLHMIEQDVAELQKTIIWTKQYLAKADADDVRYWLDLLMEEQRQMTTLLAERIMAVQQQAGAASGTGQAGVGAGAGAAEGGLLTLREAVRLTLPTLKYETELSSQTILTPSRHKPKQVKRWEDFAPGTERFVADLPDTSPVLTPPRAVDPADHSLGEETTIFLMEKYHFAYLKRLGGGSTGLPEVDYAWHKQKDLAGSDGQRLSHKSRLNRGWVWRNPAGGGWQMIVAAEAKQAYSLPFRPGWDMVDEYINQATPWTKPSSVALQLMQLCGHMRIDGVKYGVLYSDRGFWFAKYCNSTDVMWVSQCVAPGQSPPLTLAASILYLVHLAVAEASASEGKPGAGGGGGSGYDSGDGSRGSGMSSSKSFSRCCLPRRISLLPAMSHIRARHASSTPVGSNAQLSMMLSGAMSDFTDTLMLGPLLGYGSTGSVHEALLPGRPAPAAVKVAEGTDGAQARLLQEVSVYVGPLAGLQGEVVPQLLGSGFMEVPGGQLPFLALPLLGPSLEDATAPLLPEEEELVVEGLVRIHDAGVLHGDVRLHNVVLPGDDAWRTDGGVGRPRTAAMWVDFSHASVFEGAAQGTYACAAELAQCRRMLQDLRARHAHRRLLARAIPAPPRAPRFALRQSAATSCLLRG